MHCALSIDQPNDLAVLPSPPPLSALAPVNIPDVRTLLRDMT